MSDHVCSNCGQMCAEDTRGGSRDVYIMCECRDSKNTRWYDDGRGGYEIYLNDARPILARDYKKK